MNRLSGAEVVLRRIRNPVCQKAPAAFSCCRGFPLFSHDALFQDDIRRTYSQHLPPTRTRFSAVHPTRNQDYSRQRTQYEHFAQWGYFCGPLSLLYSQILATHISVPVMSHFFCCVFIEAYRPQLIFCSPGVLICVRVRRVICLTLILVVTR